MAGTFAMCQAMPEFLLLYCRIKKQTTPFCFVRKYNINKYGITRYQYYIGLDLMSERAVTAGSGVTAVGPSDMDSAL